MLLTLITSLCPSVGCSFFNGSLRSFWYQKNALIGFFGASASFFLRVFFSGLSESLVFLGFAIPIKSGLDIVQWLKWGWTLHYSDFALNGEKHVFGQPNFKTLALTFRNRWRLGSFLDLCLFGSLGVLFVLLGGGLFCGHRHLFEK